MGIGAWEGMPPRELLIIAIPHTGLTHFEFGVGLKILQPPVAHNIISNRGLPIDRARCDLVDQAKKLGASHLFFLDSDVVLPPDGLLRLWSRKLPVISGIYGSKHQTPAVWIEQAKSGDSRYSAVAPHMLDGEGLFSHKDIVLGAGCLLVEMTVFDRIKEPYFLWTQGREPGGVSEDFYFFEKLREADIPVHVEKSVKCKHLDLSMLTWDGKRDRIAI